MPLQEIEVTEVAEAPEPCHDTMGQHEVIGPIPEMVLVHVLQEVPAYEQIEVRPTVPSPAGAVALEGLALQEVPVFVAVVEVLPEVQVSEVAVGVLPEVPVLEVLVAAAQEALVA